MILCSYCSTPNREGELFCDECGNPLQGSPSVSTRKLTQIGASGPLKRPFWGTTRFRSDASVVMRLADVAEPVALESKPKLMIGRQDPASNNFPDIDLTPYGAIDNGVSRVHACIQRSEDAITVIDLDSVNGTYLNGQRLIPNQPRVLQDGDEVRFGKLATRIYFQ